MEILALLAFVAVAVLILGPIVLIVLQSRLLRQQREVSENLQGWRNEIHRELHEVRRLIDNLGRRVQTAGMAAEPEPEAQARAAAEPPAEFTATMHTEPAVIEPSATDRAGESACRGIIS